MKKLLFLLLSILLCVSCTQDIDVIVPPQTYWPYVGYYQAYTTNANGQYVIGGYTSGQRAPLTRAAITSGTYEDFALYAWTADSVIMDGYHGVFQGNTWGYNEAVKYFDNDEDEYSFIGIIPQTATQTLNAATNSVTVEGLTSFTTDDAGAQVGTQNGAYAEDREFLYATTAVQEGHYGEGATLSFNHGNIKVYLKFTSDNPNTKIVDFTPYTPYQPAIAGIKTEKSGGAFNLMSDGYFVGYPYDSNLESSETGAHGFTYVGVDNGTYKAATWLLSMKDAVNSQFAFVDENGSDISNVDWVIKGDRKNKVFIKFANAETQANVISGNDAFRSGVEAVENTAFTNSMLNNNNFKYSSGWRAVRISEDSPGKVCVWYMANTNMTVQTISGGSPEVQATGKEGIIILPATSALGNGSDASLASYPATVNATVGLSNVTYTQQTAAAEVIFTLPTEPQEFTSATTRVASPTTWYTFPAVANSTSNVGYTIKFSYTYDGILTKYDNRVFLPASECQWQEGKYYTYIINIRGKGNGKVDPANADDDDPKVPQSDEITVTSVIVDYISGEEYEHIIH